MNDPIFEKLVFYIVNNDPHGFSDLLKKYPLEIKTKGSQGWTLFHYAAEYQNSSIGKELLSKGADLNAKDDFGNNVLWRATFSSKGKGEFIQFLIENGAERFAKNNSGISPMDLADTIDNYNVKQHFEEK